jgi:hypothetical protein
MDDLVSHRQALRARGHDTGPVDDLVQAIASSAPSARPALVAQLTAAADGLPWPADRDYGALALEDAARTVVDGQLRLDLLAIALRRAAWCASCATSGGEGTSRVRHVHDIEAAMRETGNLGGPFSAVPET